MSDKGILKVEGIECDNTSCDYSITSIDLIEYERWVNKSCPKCGQILLTDKGFNLFKFLNATTSIANKLDINDPRQTAKVYQTTIKGT